MYRFHFYANLLTMSFILSYTSNISIASTYSLSFSTYLGSSGIDYSAGVVLDSTGNIYVTGSTESTLPMINPYDGTHNGGYDVFVIKLDPTGSQILYSTYIGGSSDDYSHGIAVDTNSNIYISGFTESSDFPTVNPLQGAFLGGDSQLGENDGFYLKLSADGSALLFSSYIGGSGGDPIYDLDIDSSNNIYLTGWTSSFNYPITGNAYDPNYNGGFDIVVSKINASGSSLLYSSYLGGDSVDVAFNIEVDNSDHAFITGRTDSTDYPTVNAHQSTHGGNTYDGFVTKINTDGLGLIYSTYLGGNDLEYCFDISIDTSGNAYVTGNTRSGNFPILNAFQYNKVGLIDAFISKFSSTGSLVYSTYLGGSGTGTGSSNTRVTNGETITVDNLGNVYVSGNTKSHNFPLVNPTQLSYGGGSFDRFISKIGPNGNSLLFSTYLGGNGDDLGNGIVLDSSDKIIVTGDTTSTDFPTFNALQNNFNGIQDLFLARYSYSNVPELTLQSPNGGEMWQANSTQQIVYSTTNVSSVTLEYSLNNGLSWNFITGATPAVGFHNWNIPNVSSTQSLVRVLNASDTIQSVSDVSNGVFSIQQHNSQLIVTNAYDNGPGSLRQTILDANAIVGAATISFANSLNGATIILTTGQLQITDDLTITGPGANQLTIDGNANDRIFMITSGNTVLISGLTISNGNVVSTNGGGIMNFGGTLTLNKCTISGNSTNASGGGIVNNIGGTLTLNECTVFGNTASFYGGGLYNLSGSISLNNSSINGNSSDVSGSGIWNSSTLNLSNSSVNGNTGSINGGGISHINGHLSLESSTVSNNSVNSDGGGIYNEGSVFISNSTLRTCPHETVS